MWKSLADRVMLHSGVLRRRRRQCRLPPSRVPVYRPGIRAAVVEDEVARAARVGSCCRRTRCDQSRGGARSEPAAEARCRELPPIGARYEIGDRVDALRWRVEHKGVGFRFLRAACRCRRPPISVSLPSKPYRMSLPPFPCRCRCQPSLEIVSVAASDQRVVVRRADHDLDLAQGVALGFSGDRSGRQVDRHRTAGESTISVPSPPVELSAPAPRSGSRCR